MSTVGVYSRGEPLMGGGLTASPDMLTFCCSVCCLSEPSAAEVSVRVALQEPTQD